MADNELMKIFIMKKYLFFIALIFFIACSKSHETTALNTVDTEFMQEVSLANFAAIDAALVADTNADDASVKSFANRVMATQPAMQNSLTTLAASLNVMLPSEADSIHKKKIAYLATLKGPLFDKSYINAQVTDYENTLSLFNKELSNGSNTEVINFARTYLPVIVQQSTNASDIQALLN